MKHLVTGGSGFLGNLIARRLLAQGESVRILDIWEDPARPKDAEFIACDIRNRDGVAKAMQGIQVVHHTVALVPLTKSGKEFHEVNVTGSQIAAEEAAKAGVEAFIHMSSSAIFGAPAHCPVTEATPLRPVEIYGRGKLAGEQAVEDGRLSQEQADWLLKGLEQGLFPMGRGFGHGWGEGECPCGSH